MKIPSHLLKSRHGIYYFRVRIPKSMLNGETDKHREMRRSLRTRDLKTAIFLAQVYYWSHCVAKDDLKHEDENWQESREKYAVGKGIFRKYATDANLDNPFDLHNLLDRLSPHEEECFAFYLKEKDKFKNNDTDSATAQIHAEHITHGSPLSTPPKKPKYQVIRLLVEHLLEKKQTAAKSTMKAYHLIASRFLRIMEDKFGGMSFYVDDMNAEVMRYYRGVILKFPAGKKWEKGVVLDVFLSGSHGSLAPKRLIQN